MLLEIPQLQLGFAIRSAAVVSLALFRAFVSQAGIETVNLLTPKAFVGLIVGAMLPCWFSSTTMKSVGSIALKMVEEVRRHFNTIPGQNQTTQLVSRFPLMPHPEKMIPQGALVILTPLIAGTLFGVETLAGSLVSGVQVCTKFMSRSPFHLEVRSTFSFFFFLPMLPYRHPTQEGHGITPRNT